jgi:hypothetical protein
MFLGKTLEEPEKLVIMCISTHLVVLTFKISFLLEEKLFCFLKLQRCPEIGSLLNNFYYRCLFLPEMISGVENLHDV